MVYFLLSNRSLRFDATKVKALFRTVTDTFAVDFGAFLRFFTPIRCVSHCISNTYPFSIWSRIIQYLYHQSLFP